MLGLTPHASMNVLPDKYGLDNTTQILSSISMGVEAAFGETIHCLSLKQWPLLCAKLISVLYCQGMCGFGTNGPS